MAGPFDRYNFRGAFTPYVPAAERKKKALAEIEALRKSGRTIEPITIEGRLIAETFWGKSWCKNLEAYSDYASRLPRGRAYVRNGSVVHLGIGEGEIDALVRGSEMYTVTIRITPLPGPRWEALASACSGQIASLVELLQGKLSRAVMEIVTDKERGLFPSPDEIELDCSCPDRATMCKHVAAVLYGVGARLDRKPELLFRLRAVDAGALFANLALGKAVSARRGSRRLLAEDVLESVFGIELAEDEPDRAELVTPTRPRRRSSR